jgi:DNA-binding protein YbaB
MFDNMKMLGALGGLMKNREQIAARIKTRLGSVRVDAEATGGSVRATVSGDLKVVSIEIKPELIASAAGNAQRTQMLHSMIAEAVNNAMASAQLEIKSAIDEEAKAMGLPAGLTDMGGLGSLFGGR